MYGEWKCKIDDHNTCESDNGNNNLLANSIKCFVYSVWSHMDPIKHIEAAWVLSKLLLCLVVWYRRWIYNNNKVHEKNNRHDYIWVERVVFAWVKSGRSIVEITIGLSSLRLVKVIKGIRCTSPVHVDVVFQHEWLLIFPFEGRLVGPTLTENY